MSRSDIALFDEIYDMVSQGNGTIKDAEYSLNELMELNSYLGELFFESDYRDAPLKYIFF